MCVCGLAQLTSTACSRPWGQTALHSLSPLLRPVYSADRSPPVITAASSLVSLSPLPSLWVLPSTFPSATRAVFLGGKSDDASCQLPALQWLLPEQNPPFTSPFPVCVNAVISHWLLFSTLLPSSRVDLVSIPMQVAVFSHLVFAPRGLPPGAPPLLSLFKSYPSSSPIETVPCNQNLHCMEV